MSLTVHDRIVAARVRMLEREPFFGLIAARLELKPDDSVNQSFTDGKIFSYSTDWATKASFDELMTAVAKAACHCALMHNLRRGSRDYATWQKACNQIAYDHLKSAGFPLPKTAELKDSYTGKAVEEVYAELDAMRVKPSQAPQQKSSKPQPQKPGQQSNPKGTPTQGEGKDDQGQPGKGKPAPSKDKRKGSQGNPGPDGQNDQPHECRDQPSDAGGDMDDSERVAAEQKTMRDMAATMQQAREISGAGLPGNLEQSLGALLFPRMDWLSLVKDFITKQSKSDYTYARYSKRGWCGKPRMFLPAMRDVGAMETLVFAVDTSISMNARKLQIAGGGLTELMDDLKFERLIVIYCDATIQRIDEYLPGDAIEIHAVGRGCTSLCPPFEYLEREQITPDVMIYFTDLGGSSPDREPEYPVIWLDQDGRNESRMKRYDHQWGRYVAMTC